MKHPGVTYVQKPPKYYSCNKNWVILGGYIFQESQSMIATPSSKMCENSNLNVIVQQG